MYFTNATFLKKKSKAKYRQTMKRIFIFNAHALCMKKQHDKKVEEEKRNKTPDKRKRIFTGKKKLGLLVCI